MRLPTNTPILVLLVCGLAGCSRLTLPDSGLAPDDAAPTIDAGVIVDADTPDEDGAAPLDDSGAPGADASSPDAALPDAMPRDIGFLEPGDAGFAAVAVVLAHEPNGRVTLGSTTALAASVDAHADVKVAYDDWVLRCTTLTSSASGVSCQAWMPVTVVDEGRRWAIAPSPEWSFAALDTQGGVDLATYRVDRHRLGANTRQSRALVWLARDWRTLVYAHDARGTPVYGQLAELWAALRAGAAVTPFASRATSVVSSRGGTHLAALDVWRLGTEADGQGLDDDLAHTFEWQSTTGTQALSRWDVGARVPRGDTSTTSGASWWAEPSWTELYAHTASGTPTVGSLQRLLGAVDAGAEVRVQLGAGVFQPCARVIYDLERTALSCLVRGALEPNLRGRDVGFVGPPTREVRAVSTTGVVVTERYRHGEGPVVSASEERVPVRWFVSEAGWIELLRTGTVGQVLAGDPRFVVQAAQRGADVRVSSAFTETTVVNACHALKVDAARDRAACVDFGTRTGAAYWYFSAHTTDGVIRDQRVCFGSATDCGALTQVPEQTRWYGRF